MYTHFGLYQTCVYELTHINNALNFFFLFFYGILRFYLFMVPHKKVSLENDSYRICQYQSNFEFLLCGRLICLPFYIYTQISANFACIKSFKQIYCKCLHFFTSQIYNMYKYINAGLENITDVKAEACYLPVVINDLTKGEPR